MKLAEMTVEHKSRWMAEKLGWTFVSCGVRGEKKHWHEPVKAGHCCHVVGREPNMTDPDMTLMLMDSPLFVGVVQKVDYESGRFYSATFGSEVSRWVSTPGEAVLDAAMLAHGFKEEA